MPLPGAGYVLGSRTVLPEIASFIKSIDPDVVGLIEVDTGSIRSRNVNQAEKLADELGMRPLQAHCHRGLGTLHRQTGQSEQARAELSTAIKMYREMEMTFWLPETEAALADVEKR